MAKHDENKDLRSIAKIARINYSNKTINYSKSTIIGIRRWGKIDFLINYCGWRLVNANGIVTGGYIDNNVATKKTYARDSKRSAKEHKLTDKTKRNGNNKRAKA